MPPEILDSLQLNSIQKVLVYNPFASDIYQLGICLVLTHKLACELDDYTL